MNIEIADRLVSLRKSNHLSQEALAEKLGISRQAVSKWERAEASPDMDNLIQLARLYHVSLDELLELHGEVPVDGNCDGETLPDGDTDKGIPQMKGAGEEIPPGKETGEEGSGDKDAAEESLARENVNRGEKKEEEYVDIGLEGVHVRDRDGSEVHIGWNGIHVDDKKMGENVHIDGKGVYVNGEKYESRRIFMGHFPFASMICVLYVVIGTLFHAWHPGWLLFLLIPLWYSFVGAVKKKNANLFAYPVLVTLLFLCAGFFGKIWHPGWLLFLTIPFYYFLAPYFTRGED